MLYNRVGVVVPRPKTMPNRYSVRQTTLSTDQSILVGKILVSALRKGVVLRGGGFVVVASVII